LEPKIFGGAWPTFGGPVPPGPNVEPPLLARVVGYHRHHGLLVLYGHSSSTSLFLNWQLSRIRHGCLDSRRTHSVKSTITTRLELNTQLQLFCYISNRPLLLFAARAFCAAALTVWNSLGVHTRSADTFLTFKNRLKTELFKSCYS